MAARVQQLDIKIGVDASGGIDALDQTDRKVATLGQRLKEMAREERASGGHEIEKLLRGAGVVGMASFLAESVGRVGEAFKEFGNEAALGETSYSKLVGRLAGSIPIIGRVVDGVSSLVVGIREMYAATHFSEDPGKAFALMSDETLKKYRDNLSAIRKAHRESWDEMSRDWDSLSSTDIDKKFTEMAAAEDRKQREIGDRRAQIETSLRGDQRAEQLANLDAEAEQASDNLTLKTLSMYAQHGEEMVAAIRDRQQKEREALDAQAKWLRDEQNKEIEAWEEGQKKQDEIENRAREEKIRRDQAAVDRSFENQRKLLAFELGALQDRAGLGNDREQQELRIAELRAEGAIKQAEYLKLSREENLSIVQRVQLMSLAFGTQQNTASQIRRILGANGGSQATGFGFQDAHYITGVTGKNEQAEKLSGILDAIEDGNGFLQGIGSAIGTLVTALPSKRPSIYSGN